MFLAKLLNLCICLENNAGRKRISNKQKAKMPSTIVQPSLALLPYESFTSLRNLSTCEFKNLLQQVYFFQKSESEVILGLFPKLMTFFFFKWIDKSNDKKTSLI